MSADQDESGKPSGEKEAAQQNEPASQEAHRDSDPPLRGSMADLEQELAQLLDNAPEEEDEDDEDDDAPLVPPEDAPVVKAPELEPFDSDPEGLAGAGYDSWGPKIDLSAPVPPEPLGLDSEEVKVALSPPGIAEDTKAESASEVESRPQSDLTPEQGSEAEAERASEAEAERASEAEAERASEAEAERTSDVDEDTESDAVRESGSDADSEPDSDVPDTQPSATPVAPLRERPSQRETRTSSSPPDAKGAFTPLGAVLVVLGLLAFVWLIRRPSNPPQKPEPSVAPEVESIAAPAEPAVAPTTQPSADDATLDEPAPQDGPAADATADAAAPSDSRAAPSVAPDPALAGSGPLPFDRVSVLSALGPFAIEAARCRRKPDPAGRVMVNAIIAPSGKIKSIATGPLHSGTKTEACILTKLRRAKLEPHAGGDETVALPVQLK